MARKVFQSFHYGRDSHRVSQIRNMGVIEGQPVLSSNEWEKVKRGGERAIKDWIDRQMTGKSCAVVLIGSETAGRKWIKYEVKKAWNDDKGLFGIYIHNLKDLNGNQSSKGRNTFADFSVGANRSDLSRVVKAYDPPSTDSTKVYAYIKNNLEAWVEEAIRIRDNFRG